MAKCYRKIRRKVGRASAAEWDTSGTQPEVGSRVTGRCVQGASGWSYICMKVACWRRGEEDWHIEHYQPKEGIFLASKVPGE